MKRPEPRHHPLGTRDAVREVVLYLQERYTDPHTWRVWAKNSGAFASAVRDAVERLWSHADLLYAANPRLARACGVIRGDEDYDRTAWRNACRAVWASLDSDG